MCWTAPCTAATAIGIWMYVRIIVSGFGQNRLLNALNVNETWRLVIFNFSFLPNTSLRNVKMYKTRMAALAVYEYHKEQFAQGEQQRSY